MKWTCPGTTLVLIGYMGSGKSTIGKLLANYYDIPFIDLDAFIEEKEKHSVSEIFNRYGEVYFRKVEKKQLTHLMTEKKQRIIALGGGTPCYYNTIKELNSDSNSITCYLKASLKTIVNRVFSERNKRPILSHLATEHAALEFVGKHLFERAPYYEQAQFIINTNEKEKEEVVNEIIQKLA